LESAGVLGNLLEDFRGQVGALEKGQSQVLGEGRIGGRAQQIVGRESGGAWRCVGWRRGFAFGHFVFGHFVARHLGFACVRQGKPRLYIRLALANAPSTGSASSWRTSIPGKLVCRVL